MYQTQPPQTNTSQIVVPYSKMKANIIITVTGLVNSLVKPHGSQATLKFIWDYTIAMLDSRPTRSYL